VEVAVARRWSRVQARTIAEDTPPIATEAIAIGAKVLWLQAGITNEETATRAKVAGLTVVMDRCIGATHRALHLPRR
jgi:predicted CoA-binding protein